MKKEYYAFRTLISNAQEALEVIQKHDSMGGFTITDVIPTWGDDELCYVNILCFREYSYPYIVNELKKNPIFVFPTQGGAK